MYPVLKNDLKSVTKYQLEHEFMFEFQPASRFNPIENYYNLIR